MQAQIKTHEFDGKTTEITIRLDDDDRRFEATVNRGRRFGEHQAATVNWPGCGAKNAQITGAFIDLLTVAHRAATMLDQLTADEFEAMTETDVEHLVAAAREKEAQP